MSDDILTPEQIVESLKKSLGDSVLDSKIQIRTEGTKKRENKNILITISRDVVHKAAEELMKISYPHLSCISGYDKGADSADLRIQYIFTIYGGVPRNETLVIFSLDLPKNDAVLPTLTDLMEGTAFTEHEKEEYLGIKIDGLAKAEHKFFLPQDFPENVYPLRKDEKKIPDTMVKNLFACGRPKRENPPLENNGGAE
ncbi:MAG: NADH-quinone oxidoreductase subunit C [Methanocorpusculum sp.]|nr:NADH-quinone oxidoreductase subunit C [Methanocorpusculum sp.]